MRSIRKPLFLFLSLTFFVSVSAVGDEDNFFHCHTKNTCHDCIQAGPSCSWCYAEAFNGTRCDALASHIETCSDAYHFPQSKSHNIRNDPISDKIVHVEERTEERLVQMRPQKVEVHLRVSDEQDIRVEYSQLEDYPVDLYYLMDLSNSMSDDKDNLAQLGNRLGEEMNKITKNFRLGFGSFVDKVAMPYVSMVPSKIEKPCDACVAPYGFINHLPLTQDTARFVQEVKNANVSGNLDAPEGGFDAIMQAVVCNRQIGWRERSRKIILFSTDAGFHYAGDGKLAGIVQPNDGVCHMENNRYTHSEVQDYPSLSQINAKIQDNKVNIIFAVTEDQEPIYSRLANMMEGCSHGTLNKDSSNVVELVKEQYEKITSSIELTSDVTEKDEYLAVDFAATCKGHPRAEGGKCSGIRVGDKIDFDVKIKLKKCPPPSERKRTIKISPIGVNEVLEVDVMMICSCDCENNRIEGHPFCGGNGAFVCGICECASGFSGKNCQCSDTETSKSSEETCRALNDNRICSGRGECHCGQCKCFPRSNSDEIVSGDFCECDNFSCDRHLGKLCGGHGSCQCGKCVCNVGWSGADCACPTSNATCIGDDGKVCSGHGTCHCGTCLCDGSSQESGRFTGQFCEECPTCPGKCDQFKDCVECQAFPENKQRKYQTDECTEICDPQFLTIKSPEIEYDEEKGDKLCIFRDADDCKITFTYREGDKRYTVKTKYKECPEPVNILAIILFVILGIVLIGLLFLFVWKLLTSIQDRRECAKFEKERVNAKWDTGENPIYKAAVTTFRNPTYGGKN